MVIWGRGWAGKGGLHFCFKDDNPLKLCAERWQAFLKSVYLFVKITNHIPNMKPVQIADFLLQIIKIQIRFN